MDLFGKIHTANEQMATSGREGIVFASRHKKPITDDISVQVFHPTTGGARSFLMNRPEAEELHGALGKWLHTGWAGFVDGAPGPGKGGAGDSGTVSDARPTLDEIERRRVERVEQDQRLEDRRRGEYASSTHDELVDEIRVLKFNISAAKTNEQKWRDAMQADCDAFKRQINALRKAIDGRKTVPVADLETAMREARES